MPRRDNIIPFDEARRKTRSSRASERTSSRPTNRTSARRGTVQSSGFSDIVYDDIFSDITFDDDVREAYQEDRIHEQSRSRSAVTATTSRTKKEQRKRDKASSRASRQFLAQFGSSSGTSEEGTRAAVYKGEMGRGHKRAFTHMADASDTRSQESGFRGVTESTVAPCNISFIIAIVAVLCLLFVAAVLYPAAQQYYIEMRNHDRLQAEYDAVLERNEAIQSDVDYLSTDLGVQDAARSDLGWVEEGENALIVQGLPEDTEDSSATAVHARIPSESIKAPDTWYSGFLDPFFGYSADTQAQI